MQELRLAIRSLRSSPAITAVAILSLALGIGANTAIFSIINSLLVRPLPVSDPQHLIIVSDSRGDRLGFRETWTYDVWRQLREHAQRFEGAAASSLDRLNVGVRGGEAEPIDVLWVSGEYFSTLGVTPLLGRPLSPGDDGDRAEREAPAAVISYALWQRQFGGAASVLGAPLVIERVPFTIVGVTPPAFFGTEVGRTFDVALPLTAERLIRGNDSRFSTGKMFAGLTVLLRLKPDQPVETAATVLRGLQPQIRAAATPASVPAAFRREFLKDPFTVSPAATGTSGLRTRYERPLFVILAVVALVLFIACANIANLQLARAIARRHDLSVRIALGASRWRVARELLIESVLLSASGAGLGILMATWTGPLLVAQLSSIRVHVYLDLALDWRVMTFAAAVAVATTILFGVVPAVRASGVDPIESLKQQPRGTPLGTARRLFDGLVISQVALSIVVVVGAGLFVRSFDKLATLPLGFETDRVLVVTVNTAHAHVDTADRHAFVRRLGDAVATLPGVGRAAVSLTTPIGGMGFVDIVYANGVSPSEALAPLTNGGLGRQSTYLNFVTPGWFATYGTTIRAGRDFNDGDVKHAPPIVIVTDAFVRKFLPGLDPIGAAVSFDRGHGAPVQKTIVGVVGDTVYNSVRQGDEPIEYAPLAQLDFPIPPAVDAVISVRASNGAPMLLVRSIAATLKSANPDLVFAFRPLSDQVSASLTQERVIALLSAFFAVLALLLAGLGLYGVTTYALVCRRTEIGIRMALGSAPGGVVRLVVARVAALVAAGILIGVSVSAAASRYVASLLFGLATYDAVTYTVSVLALIAAAALAAWLPAARASRIDPAEVLRES